MATLPQLSKSLPKRSHKFKVRPKVQQKRDTEIPTPDPPKRRPAYLYDGMEEFSYADNDRVMNSLAMATADDENNRTTYGIGTDQIHTLIQRMANKSVDEQLKIVRALPVTPQQQLFLLADYSRYHVPIDPTQHQRQKQLYGLDENGMRLLVRELCGAETVQHKINAIKTQKVNDTQKSALYALFIGPPDGLDTKESPAPPAQPSVPLQIHKQVSSNPSVDVKSAVSGVEWNLDEQCRDVLESMKFYIDTQPTGLVARILVRELALWVEKYGSRPHWLLDYIAKSPYEPRMAYLNTLHCFRQSIQLMLQPSTHQECGRKCACLHTPNNKDCAAAGCIFCRAALDEITRFLPKQTV